MHFPVMHFSSGICCLAVITAKYILKLYVAKHPHPRFPRRMRQIAGAEYLTELQD
jgi:cytochrome b561